jgi:hypothetical protein
MTQDLVFSEISRKLNVLCHLLAYQTVAKMTLSEGAPLLKRLGFTNSEIASVYDSTANTVAVRLNEAKKKTKKG